MKRRRRPLPPTPIKPGEQWTDFSEQCRLQGEHHTQSENAAARLRAAQLVAGGHGSVDWSDPDQLCVLWEQK